MIFGDRTLKQPEKIAKSDIESDINCAGDVL